MQIKRLTFNEYPLLLRQIERPPPFLDIVGAPIPESGYKFLCIIGARKYTKYGEEVVRHLISGLKDQPIIIVSGLAIGIDSIAHEQALACNLKTIAVPGSGLDENVIYPPSHLHIAKKIIAQAGTLISPFERDQSSTLWTFPVRNRLLAGLCHATLVVEGREGSGTLLTAKHAVEFNRDVMIVPGSIFSDTSYGPHLLYKEGAIPVTNSSEILQVLDLIHSYEKPHEQKKSRSNRMNQNTKSNMQNIEDHTKKSHTLGSTNNIRPTIQNSLLNSVGNIFEQLSSQEKNIITLLSDMHLTNTDLITKTGLSAIDLNILLTNLELNNLIVYDGNFISLKR